MMSLYEDYLKLCGCGYPDDVKKFITQLLINIYNYGFIQTTHIQLIKETSPELLLEVILQLIDAYSTIVDHAMSTSSTFLTDEGVALLEELTTSKHLSSTETEQQ